MFKNYDLIVVGAGHAGCEAAAAAANMGSSVLLITMNMQNIAQMSCNPAMGGIAKGQIIREIDAIGGYSGIVSDRSMIQFRMLNKSKGPAMWSPRTQNDRMMFSNEWRTILESIPNIDFWQGMVTGIEVENGVVTGVKTGMGLSIPAKSVVLTNGTFLNGIIHIGEKQFSGGRSGERAATGITEQLRGLGFESGRMKTGTPPRIDGRSIDYTQMEVQYGDDEITGFSFGETDKPEKQRNCWIAYTNPEVHHMLKQGFNRSPMFNGRIKGTGPRYCPSIEDKIDRFEERERHQLFVEPEGWNTVEIYLNGFSTSLPLDIQQRALNLIPGFQNARMFRPGYAIEYDYFPPIQLTHTLETKLVKNLFFAGQINGTTGYEEAACQGLMAGINAHQKLTKKEAFILKRSDAYIGVLIDDLINKGTDEPYRMFTSRAEYRIILRQDNADIRLTELSHDIGLADEIRMERVSKKKMAIKEITRFIQKTSISMDDANPLLQSLNSTAIDQSLKLAKLVGRPNISINHLKTVSKPLQSFLDKYDEESVQAAEVTLKYQGYVAKEEEMVEKMSRLEAVKLSDSLNYQSLNALSAEAQEKLNKIKPKTLGQASRISGISPADISVLMVYVGR